MYDFGFEIISIIDCFLVIGLLGFFYVEFG
jgi:hypothetical protein